MFKQTVYCFCGKPVISIPQGSIVDRLHFLSFYPAFTIKKKTVRLYIALCMLAGIDRIISYIGKKPKQFMGMTVDAYSDFIVEYFTKQGYDSVLLFWGTHSKRRRVYIYLFDQAGNHTAFGKISCVSEDYSLVENEISALRKYSKSSLAHVSIPSLCDFGDFFGGKYIITAALPKKAELVRQKEHAFPFEIRDEYSGLPVVTSIGSVLDARWWLKYCELRAEFSIFDDYIQLLMDQDISLASVHGDFGSTNIFIYNNKYWIIDWEQFCDKGPYLADEISYWLGANYHDLCIESDMVFINFSCFIEKRMFERQDVMFALVFLIAADFNLAWIIAKNWDKVLSHVK